MLVIIFARVQINSHSQTKRRKTNRKERKREEKERQNHASQLEFQNHQALFYDGKHCECDGRTNGKAKVKKKTTTTTTTTTTKKEAAVPI